MYVPLDEQLVHTKYKSSSGIVEKIQFKDIILSVSLTTDDGDTDDCVLWLKNPSRDDLKSLMDGLFFQIPRCTPRGCTCQGDVPISQADPGTISEVATDDGQFTVRVEPEEDPPSIWRSSRVRTSVCYDYE